MTPLLQQLVDALRHELQQYGEMLALLETRPGLSGRQQAPALHHSLVTFDAQRTLLEAARRERVTAQHSLAQLLSRPAPSSVTELLPAVPAEYRPLLHALAEENAELAERVRSQAEQTHLVIGRTLTSMQRFIQNLSSEAPAPAFHSEGQSEYPIAV